MIPIHVPTLLVFSTFLSVFLGGLLIWLWRRDRDQPALAYWGTARLLGAAGLALLAARGKIPVWVSIDVGNALIYLAFGLIWAGARRFERRRLRLPTILAGPAIWLLACQVPAFHGSLGARTVMSNAIMSLSTLAAGWEFHRGRMDSPLPSRGVMESLLGATALVYFVGGMLAFLIPFGQRGDALPAALWYGLTTTLGVCLMAGLPILLVALTKEAAEFHSTTALSAARDAANEASEQKTRFLVRMSHELRTPLNGVLGMAQVLASDPNLGEAQRREAETLEQAGRHLLAILNEVLDLSRIEAGRLDLVPRPLGLAAFLRETVGLVAGTSLAKGVAFDVAAAPDLPDTVLADAMRLRQVLLNLLNNAVKFTPAGGSVALSVSRGARERLRFAVTDTGTGVPAALRPRLFQDYAQAQANDGTSSGLGLAISARLAAAMGGELTHADGPDGRGSCFTLVLPLPVAQRPPVAAEAPRPLLPGGLRILVVDDVALNRLTARALLEHAGHVVEVAEDGPSALAAIQRGPLPDVVLMDQSMPGMDGNTAARHIRALGGAAGRVPILAVTANALPEDIKESLAAGMDGHVVKPIDVKQLMAAIAVPLGRSRGQMPAHAG